MLLKCSGPRNEAALKEWIWSNYKDKLLASMSILEESDQQSLVVRQVVCACCLLLVLYEVHANIPSPLVSDLEYDD